MRAGSVDSMNERCYRGLVSKRIVLSRGLSQSLYRAPGHENSLAKFPLRRSALSSERLPLQELEGDKSTQMARSPPGPDKQQSLKGVATFVKDELERVFTTGSITSQRYSKTFRFRDPIASFDTLDGYMLNLRLLRGVFGVNFIVHNVFVASDSQVCARWTMVLKPKWIPWQPDIVVTGKATYTAELPSGLLLSHVDEWDGVEDGSLPSVQAAILAASQAADVSLLPQLDTPKYTVLRRARDYEIRQYQPYLVAEVAMPAGAGPASGEGFNELAGYIFGGNRDEVSMEMTTPVITTTRGDAPLMQFVMENRYSDPASLPVPRDERVGRSRDAGGVVAALRFGGWPSGGEAVRAERALRSRLLRDGLRPDGPASLARYNEPFVPPPLRRNEVLIRLKDFHWPQDR